MKYVDLNLDHRLLEAIQKIGYEETTPIQAQAFEPIVNGQDVAGLAQTGTGKTAAFLIPLIERILKAETDPAHQRAFKDWKASHCVLILVPTRELADQIHENIQKLTINTGLKSFQFYGGTGYEKQKEALSANLQFIVSTPGRLIDLYKEHFVDFKKVKAIVFDEADRMFDMGFKEDMKYILSRIDRQRQFLVFSATLNFDVLNTAYQFGSEPVEINISKDVAKADNVQDVIIHLGNDEKPQHLISIIKKVNPRQTIVFTNFKNNVDRIAQFLTDNQVPAMGISSLISQNQRNHVISKFKESNNQNVLVATDVAARGLDISDVDLVVNFELPQDCESYVHRIGRTGRAGEMGKAYSLVSEKDVESLSRIEEFTKKKIEAVFLEDAELLKDLKPMTESERFNRAPFESKRSSQQQRGSSKFDSKSDRRSKGAHDRKDRGPRNDFEKRPEQKGSGPRPMQSVQDRAHVKLDQSQVKLQKNSQPRHGTVPQHANGKSTEQKQFKKSNFKSKDHAHKNQKGMISSSARSNPRRQNSSPGFVGAVKSFFKRFLG